MPDSANNHTNTTGNVRNMTIGAFLIVLSSILRAFWADSVMVDNHALTGTPALFIYCLFIGGLGWYSWNFCQFWCHDNLFLPSLRRLSYGMVLLFSLMPPMLSNDVFSLLTYGDLANHGVDIFNQAHLSGQSVFLSYDNPNAADGPNVYGPLCIAFMRLATFFSANNIAAALIAFKFVTLFWSVLFVEAACRISSLLTEGLKPLSFIILNPLFLIQGVGQQHVDLLSAALALWAIWFVLNDKIFFSFIPIALAIAVKTSYVLLVPYSIVALYLKNKRLISTAALSLGGIAMAAACLGVLYWPYYSSPQTLLAPVLSLYSQVPTKSLVEVFGDIIFYVLQLFHSGGLSGVMTSDNALAAEKEQIYAVLIFIFRFFALTVSLFLAVRFIRSKGDKASLTSLYLRLLLLFLLFYSHVIYPWYLLLALPFVWFEKDKGFMTWLLVLTCFCNAQGIMCSIDRSSWVYALVVPLIAINAVIFLWRFKANFLNKIA